MRKIAICGCGGSGKSAIARQLSDRLELPVTHLDMVYYDEQWNPLSHDEFAAVQRRLVSEDRWILDGNYAGTMPIRLAAADVVIFLDIHPLVCLWGILQRRRHHRGSDELSRHLRGNLNWGFVKYILSYRTTMRPKVRTLLEEHATGNVIVLTSRRAARRYVETVSVRPETS
ncbi:topology modulation protein [Actinopolyspora erythraea]|uniref:Topology modulation protein n=1 Tax=Actinopolyspora erythraea TaxID=414996 RepID=A0A099D5H8_9ACTN|nr:topology modulation protein [Actinopolyspora erythraea]ASU79137.1 topology modulation protein [Actinopolyspora erythraea]KGI80590.1 topology modulation protein [Actinopolyspora erythraea]